MDCEICKNNKSKRTISGISMCEDCFSKIAALRNNDVKAIAFLKNPDNLKNASENAKTYIQSLINSKENLFAEIKAAEQQMEIEKQNEQKKANYAHSVNGYYEYGVVLIENTATGSVNVNKLREILSEYSSKGWKLHSIYSNELGKNALLGINATASQDVLIFERKIEPQKY